jgi:hypothetical protein
MNPLAWQEVSLAFEQPAPRAFAALVFDNMTSVSCSQVKASVRFLSRIVNHKKEHGQSL